MKSSWPEACIALAEGRSIAEAARRADVNERTVRRWMKDEVEFATKLNDLRADKLEDAGGRLCALAVDAVDVVGELLHDENPNVRLRASQTVLDAAKSYRDHIYIESKISELELAIRGRNP